MRAALLSFLVATLVPTLSAHDSWDDRSSLMLGAVGNANTGIAYGNGRFVVITSSSAGTFRTSAAGTSNWTHPGSGIATGLTSRGIAFGNGVFVVIGSSAGNVARIFTSATGNVGEWTERTSGVTRALNGVRFLNGLFVVPMARLPETTMEVLTSPDGITWTSRQYPAATVYDLNDVAFKPGLTAGTGTWVFGTNTAGRNVTITENFATATVRTNSDLGTNPHLWYSAEASVFVLVDDSGKIHTSADGVTFTKRHPAGATGPSLYNVTHDGERFAAVGNQVTGSSPAVPTLLHSTDGITWTQATTVPTTTASLRSIIRADGLWMAGGTSRTLFTSGNSSIVAPEFTTDPQFTAADVGSSAMLTAEASGAPTPTYTWFRNNVQVTDGNGFSGADTDTLVIDPLTLAHAGEFYCRATNTAGSVNSNPARLTVTVSQDGVVFTPVGTAGGTPPFSDAYRLAEDAVPFMVGVRSNGVRYYTPTTGLQLASGIYTALADLSEDGTQMLVHRNDANPPAYLDPFTGVATVLPAFPGIPSPNVFSATGLAPNGNICGIIQEGSQNRAFHYHAATTTYTLLGAFPDTQIADQAVAISDDGLVVAGYERNFPGAFDHPFIWTALDGFTILPNPQGGVAGGDIRDISGNARFIVGFGQQNAANGGGSCAMRWDRNGGAPVGKRLPRRGNDGFADAYIVTDDGTAGGMTQQGSGLSAIYRAAVWTPNGALYILQDYLNSEHGITLAGWTLERVQDISADGLTLAGSGLNPAGETEGWVLTLPAPLPEPPAVADISVEQPALTLLESGVSGKSFGSSQVGVAGAQFIFSVRNTGFAELTDLEVDITGTDLGDWEITAPLSATTLAPNEAATFSLRFTAGALGTRNATLEVASSDGDENPFAVNLVGVGAPPPSLAEIEVVSTVTTLTDGVSTLAYGDVTVGANFSKFVTIRNVGTEALNNLSLTFIGTHAADFDGTLGATVSLAPAGEVTFVLAFDPSAEGARTATLQINSNDANENPFDIFLTGTGVAATSPVFSTPPQTQLLLLGSPAAFEPVVAGSPVITFQWKKNGANIAKATNSSFSIPVTKAADVGAYTLVADNDSGGPVTSPKAYLGLVTPQQNTLTLKAGTILNLTCTAVAYFGPGVSLSYSWSHDGDPLENGATGNGSFVSGATSKALKITGLATLDSGVYTCMVTMTTPTGSPSIANGDTVVNVVSAKPVLEMIVPANASVSELINIPLNASNFPTSFAATGLPPGLTLNTKTGVISGRPTKAKIVANLPAPYTVKFTATNPSGVSAPMTVEWTIEPLDPSLIGTFNGLVSRDGPTNFGMGGVVQITTASTGLVTGSATLAGQKHSVTGVLDISVGNDPTATLTVKRAPPTLGNLILEMTIVTGGNSMTGTLRDDQFVVIASELAVGNGTAGFADGDFGDVLLNGPRGIALLGEGGYIADTGNHVIRVVGESVSTFAGLAETSGSDNGTGGDARFNGPEGIVLDAAGNLFVADTGNGSIRKITPVGVVTTVAAPAGAFVSPCGLTFDDKGNLIVVDRGNHTLKKISPSGIVTTLAGKAGISGHKDAAGTAALFNGPRGVTFDAKLKAFFVADTGNRVIRKVTPTGAVSTYAGAPGVEGYASGLAANARFIAPMGIASDGEGTLVVADTFLVQITPGGIVATISDRVLPGTETDQPVAVVFNMDNDGGVLAADAGLHGITSHEGTGPLPGAGFVAYRQTWTTAAPVPPERVGAYTAGIATGQEGDAAYPQGQGYATLAVTRTGIATGAGKAADGSALTFGTTVGPEGQIVLHQMLYRNTGSLQGMTFINDDDDWFSANGVDTPFDWYKIAQPNAVVDRIYKAGFILHSVTLEGGKYTPANQVFTFLNITPATTTANALVTFSEGGLAGPFSQDLNVKAPSTVTVPTTGNPNTVKLTVTGSSGIFTGSFNQGTRKATVAGVLTRNTASNFRQGRGYFLLPQDTTTTGPQLSGEVIIQAD